MRDLHEGERVSHSVVERIAAIRGIDQAELAPLYDTIDPDALDALYEKDFDGSIAFRHAGCRVIVDGDGRVRVSEDPDVESWTIEGTIDE